MSFYPVLKMLENISLKISDAQNACMNAQDVLIQSKLAINLEMMKFNNNLITAGSPAIKSQKEK